MLISGVSASVSANLILLAVLYGFYQDADILMGLRPLSYRLSYLVCD